MFSFGYSSLAFKDVAFEFEKLQWGKLAFELACMTDVTTCVKENYQSSHAESSYMVMEKAYVIIVILIRNCLFSPRPRQLYIVCILSIFKFKERMNTNDILTGEKYIFLRKINRICLSGRNSNYFHHTNFLTRPANYWMHRMERFPAFLASAFVFLSIRTCLPV